MIKERLSVREVADLLGCSTGAVYRMINDGLFPAYRPTPRRTWLKRAEVLATYEVPAVLKSKFRVVEPALVTRPPNTSGKPKVTQLSRKPKLTFKERLRAKDQYADLLQRNRRAG